MEMLGGGESSMYSSYFFFDVVPNLACAQEISKAAWQMQKPSVGDTTKSPTPATEDN